MLETFWEEWKGERKDASIPSQLRISPELGKGWGWDIRGPRGTLRSHHTPPLAGPVVFKDAELKGPLETVLGYCPWKQTEERYCPRVTEEGMLKSKQRPAVVPSSLLEIPLIMLSLNLASWTGDRYHSTVPYSQSFPFPSELLAGPGHLPCWSRLYRALARGSDSAHVWLRAPLEQSFCWLEYNWRLRMLRHSIPRMEVEWVDGWWLKNTFHYLVSSEHLPALFF